MRRNFNADTVDAKTLKQKFMKGQPYNIVKFLELKDAKTTSY